MTREEVIEFMCWKIRQTEKEKLDLIYWLNLMDATQDEINHARFKLEAEGKL